MGTKYRCNQGNKGNKRQGKLKVVYLYEVYCVPKPSIGLRTSIMDKWGEMILVLKTDNNNIMNSIFKPIILGSIEN